MLFALRLSQLRAQIRHFLRHHITQGYRVRGLTVNLVEVVHDLIIIHRSEAQTDLVGLRIDLDNLGFHFLSHTDDLFGIIDFIPAQLRQMDQPLHPVFQLGKGTKIRHLDDFHLHILAHVVLRRHQRPWIRLKLLEAQGQALVFFVHIQHHGPYRLTFFEHFGRMFDPLRPRQVGNVNQSVNALFQCDKGTEIRQVAHFTFNFIANRIAFVHRAPRVRLNLLHAERNALTVLVHTEHHRLNRVANLDDFRRVTGAPRPRHLRYVHEPLNALFQLDKGPVICNAHHLARHARRLRVLLVHIRPRIGRQLLETQRHALVFLVELQHHHPHLVANGKQLRRMADPAPRHVGNVQEPIDATEIDKGAVFGDIFDHALDHLPLGQ